MSGRAKILIIAALVCLPLSGCVYYNTFYHAKTAFREAEALRETRPPDSDPGAQERNLLERAVEKSGRVLKLHPDSDWADDALLLLGKALFRQDKLQSAEERLTAFIELYPDSELLPEAVYTLAAVHVARGNPVAAEEVLEPLAFAEPPRELSAEALALVGRARNARGRHEEAAEAYRAVLEGFPNSERRAEVRILAAENYVEMGRLEEAVRQLETLDRESGSRALLLEGRLRLAEIRLMTGDTDGALDVLEDLELRTTDRDELDRVLLLKGRALEARGEFDDAISTYEGVAVSHPKSVASAEARYRIGVIKRDALGDLAGASESFKLAKSDAPRDDVGKLASEAVEDLRKLEQLLLTIEQWETTGGDAGSAAAPDRPVREAAALADSLTPAGPAPGDSLASARPALADSLTSAGPAVADSLAVGLPALGDSAGAERWAENWDAEEEDPRERAARARLRAAEIYLLRFDDPDRALPHYEKILAEHASSAVAPKAALAVAWIMDHKKSDAAAAIEAYRTVVESFPESDYAAAAEEALARLSSD